MALAATERVFTPVQSGEQAPIELADDLAATERLFVPAQRAPFTLSLRLRLLLWRLVSATLYRFTPNPLRPVRRALLRLFGATVSPTASPNNHARIDHPWNLAMGHCASIGEHAWVYCLDRVVLEDYACVGQHVFLLTGTHDYDDPGFPLRTAPVRVGRGAWIATRATVLPGAHIGAYAVIGAGSVVCHPMPPRMVCAGNPCRPLKPRRLPGLSPAE